MDLYSEHSFAQNTMQARLRIDLHAHAAWLRGLLAGEQRDKCLQVRNHCYVPCLKVHLSACTVWDPIASSHLE